MRNYGFSSKFEKTGAYACKSIAATGHMSHQSAHDIGERWRSFAEWSRSEYGISKTEQVTREMVQSYGQALGERVRDGQMAASTAQNAVSAVNTVMTICRGDNWKSVSPTKECGIEKRDNVRTEPPKTADRATYERGQQAVREAVGDRAAAVVGLARDLGLRSREALTIDARAALVQAEREGRVTISAGTKGGRERTIEAGPREIAALREAARYQPQGSRSMLFPRESYHGAQAGWVRDAREGMRATTGDGLHDCRAAWAADRYRGYRERGMTDREARQHVAEDLGHGRTEILKHYLA